MNKEVEISGLVEFLQQIPSINRPVEWIVKKKNWSIKLQIDIDNVLAWRVIQEIANVTNYLSIDEKLPCRFYPISRPPYLNGGPRDSLFWVIENTNSKFSPDNLVEWLESRMPDPVDDLTLWDEEE